MRLTLVVLCVTLAASAPRMPAQSTLGAILGTVQDPSGAMVSGANVSLKNTAANNSVTRVSSPEGLFEFLNLQPGPYELAVEKPGFVPARTGEIRLEARQTRRADFTLLVAPQSETVVVSARVPIINTENGTISDSMTSEQVTRLPTNYRGLTTNPMFLVLTVPGVVWDGVPADGGAVFGLSIGGGLPTQIESSVDGVSTIDVRIHLPGVIAPSAEMVSEFRVSSAGNSAAFGQMGDVTIITKNGTNQVHGSAFWYHQNAALDATTYGSPQKQEKVFHTFGGSLGAPVYIPHVYDGHNRTFLFADFEGNRKPQSTLHQDPVPTLAMRQGDLNGLSGGDAVDPLNGAPFPGNRIPAARISSVASNLLSKYYPAPNVAVAPDDLNYRLLMPLNEDTNGYDLRLDQVIGPRQQMFVRWGQKFNDFLLDDYYPLEGETESLSSKNLVISHTFTPRPNVSNEFRLGLSFYWPKLVSALRGKDAVAGLGLLGLNLSNVGDSGGFPLFDFGDGTNFPVIGAAKDYVSQSRTIQPADTFSWIHGRHTAKFGAEMRRIGMRQTLLTNGAVHGYDEFGGQLFSSQAFSGNAFADLLLGLPAQSAYSALGPQVNQFSSGYSFFAQDNWKISPSFNLEFGLRWELHPPMSEQSGNLASFDHSTADVITPDHTIPLAPGFLEVIHACSAATGPCPKVLSASQAGLPEGLRRTYYGDWDPRLGFAWHPWPSGKMVFRGGIGIYTVPLLGRVASVGVGQLTSDNRTFTNYQGPGVPPLFTFPDAYPDPSARARLVGVAGLSGTNPTLKDPRSYQWNFTIERELPWATSLSASYIGIQSSGLTEGADFNQPPVGQPAANRPFPFWRGLGSTENLGFASYEGLQTELTRRLRNGLFFQASYVFSKNIGDGGTLGGRFLRFPMEGNVGVTNRFNTRYDRGTLVPSRQQRFLLTALLPLPFGRGRALGSSWRGLCDGVLGGWELSTVTLVESGPYQTPRLGNGRPDRIGNGNLANPTRDRYYDASAFVPVPAGVGRLGNAGAGILEGPGVVAIAAGLAKTFRMTEKLRLRLESTFTNLPNHPNFTPPNVFIGNKQFGKLTSVWRGENAGNRTGQVSARLDF